MNTIGDKKLYEVSIREMVEMYKKLPRVRREKIDRHFYTLYKHRLYDLFLSYASNSELFEVAFPNFKLALYIALKSDAHEYRFNEPEGLKTKVVIADELSEYLKNDILETKKLEREVAKSMINRNYGAMFNSRACMEALANSRKMPRIARVIFNDPATVVFWSDGTKTVVKAQNGVYDKMTGLAMCISKKALGNKGNYFNEFKKWCGEFEDTNQICKDLEEVRKQNEAFDDFEDEE